MNSIIFNNKNIHFKRINGVYWIVVKSVCEALNVNYNRQFQNIKEDPILVSAFAKQQMQIPGDDQRREYICLPEEFIYEWIFSIKSDSPELVIYKKECYHILFSHFHGTITKRAELYSELSKERKITSDLESNLRNIPDFIKWEESKMREMRLWKDIKKSSREDMDDLFKDENFD
jgi:hypothetical protein